MKLVDREHFNPTDISVAAQAERIKAAAPQALIGWTAGTATGTMLRGLHDGGVDVPVVGGNANMVYQQLAQYTAFLPKELYFSGRRAIAADPSAPPKIRAAEKVFFDAYQSIDVRPNLVSTIGWDPAMLYIEALRKIGPDATAAQINDFIQHTNGWVGINGVYDFRDGSQRGIGIDSVVMDRYDASNNSFVAVSKPGGYIK
jgi:branched-chain amino acid transport system substrate-binding protein